MGSSSQLLLTHIFQRGGENHQPDGAEDGALPKPYNWAEEAGP